MSKKQPDMTALTQLLTVEIDAEALAKMVDEVAFDYADSLICQAEEIIPGKGQATNLYYLKMIRDAIWKAEHPDPVEH